MRTFFRSLARPIARLFLGASLIAPCVAPCAVAAPGTRSPALSSRPDVPQTVQGFPLPPPDPPGVDSSSPTLPEMMQQFRQDMRHYFDRAEDPRTHLVSRQGAQRARWGYAVQHFEAMDANHDGELSFDEVWNYVLAHLH